MKRFITLFAAIATALGLLAGTALAGGHEWHHVDPHGHVMLIGAEVVEIEGQSFVFYDRCVEFAKGEPLPTPAHHHSIHTGTAGGSPVIPGALFHAGNWVIPLSPFGFGTGCESFSSPFPLPPLP